MVSKTGKQIKKRVRKTAPLEHQISIDFGTDFGRIFVDVGAQERTHNEKTGFRKKTGKTVNKNSLNIGQGTALGRADEKKYCLRWRGR